MATNEQYYDLHEVAGAGVDPYHLFVASVPLMADKARAAAADESYSYRNFNVGAAAFAVDPHLGRTAITSGGNWKLAPEVPKYCAEMAVLDELVAHGYPGLIGIVVAATSDKAAIEEVTFQATETLHMCDACINHYDGSAAVNDDLLVVTCGLESDGYQCHTFGELKAYYEALSSGEPAAERFHHATNDFDAWNERRLFVYDHLTTTAGHYGAEASGAELAHMALSAVSL